MGSGITATNTLHFNHSEIVAMGDNERNRPFAENLISSQGAVDHFVTSALFAILGVSRKISQVHAFCLAKSRLLAILDKSFG